MAEPVTMRERRHAAEHLEEHFQDLATQQHASQLGMWVFLGTEILFFGALFVLYATLRMEYGHAFAEGTHHTDLLLGSLGTYVLLAASFLVALAVHSIRGRWNDDERDADDARSDDDVARRARRRRDRRTALLLWGAAVMGALFLVCKFTEYAKHFREGLYPGIYYDDPNLQLPGVAEFWNLYYLMTGLHALHVIGGIGILTWLGVRAWRGHYEPLWHNPIELGGMYWHFVDVVWLFLWPCFYLIH